MYFIPLSQIESVELVIHCLKAAGGEVDCRSCPASRVCTKQCLTIAAAIEQMFGEESQPGLDEAARLLRAELSAEEKRADSHPGGEAGPDGKPRLTLVKS